jgi:phage terminase Nu1 subunit (DNA packaging protein)
MARAISVKVATQKVITALEAKLGSLDSELAASVASEQAFDIAWKEYQTQLTNYAVANIAVATNFRTSHRSYANTLNIDYDVPVNLAGFPVEPKRDFEQVSEYTVKTAKEEITNALNILKMTDEEYVSASTMKSIASYL